MHYSALLVSAAVCAAASAATAACVTADQAREAGFRIATQAEFDEVEAITGAAIAIAENPNFAAAVASGDLPPIEERLPTEPLVIFPFETCGPHGGFIVGASLAYEVATSGMMSWRQVNLVRLSPGLDGVLPDVAKSFSWNDDRTELTFELRDGHRWSDGAPFTSADVAFWMNDIVNNPVLHPTTPYPWNIGARAEVISETEVKLVFDVPFPSALEYLTGLGMWHAAFAPAHFLQQFHPDYNPNAEAEALAAGYTSWAERFSVYWSKWTDATTSRPEGVEVPTLESHVMVSLAPEMRVFRANPYFHRVDSAGLQLPYIEEQRERFLSNAVLLNEVLVGNIDIEELSLSLTDYPIIYDGQEAGAYRVSLPIAGDGPVLIFNQTFPDDEQRNLFTSVDFRRAVSLALRRDEINEVVFLGQGVPRQALPLGIDYVSPEMEAAYTVHDLDEANRLLDGLGMTRGEDGFRRLPSGEPFTLSWEYSLALVVSAEFPALVAASLEEVGLRMVLREVSTQQVRENGAANRNQIGEAWRAPFLPTFISRPVAMYPPFNDVSPQMGQPWVEWMNTSGASGQEPPAWAKRLFEIFEIWPSLDPQSAEFEALAQEVVQIHVDQLIVIGTIGQIKRPMIFGEAVKNMSDWTYSILDFGFASPYNPDQWVIER